MKRLIIILILSLVFISCKENVSNLSVLIISKSDTIKINETYEAELHVIYKDSILPDFYIVFKLDTFLLPFDEMNKCADFKAVGRKNGKVFYKGYVNYFNKEGVRKKENFQIEFFVK